MKWKDLLLGSEDWQFLPETALRTFIMFLIIVTSLRILGKRGVKQLFNNAIILPKYLCLRQVR